MRKFNWTFEILSFEPFKKAWKLSSNNLKKLNESATKPVITLDKGTNIYYPLSFVLNGLNLLKSLHIKKKGNVLIHARADYSSFLCLILKPLHRLPVIWDCRGDSISELEDSLAAQNPFVRIYGRFYLLPLFKYIVQFIATHADGAIFVSNALYSSFHSSVVTRKIAIIPCSVSPNLFYFDPYIRTTKRQELGLGDHNRVFLYSGSMVDYQFLDEHKRFFTTLLKDIDNRILIITPDTQKAKQVFNLGAGDRVKILSASFADMNQFCNAADFGMLLREQKTLNFVASPTKFGEYCMSGLPVVMNDTVDQAFHVSKMIGNHISATALSFEPKTINERLEISKKANNVFSREVVNAQYAQLYARCINENAST